MADWKTLKSEVIEVGANNFIEVNLKENPDGQELLGISKGWFTPDGDKRYKTNILISLDKVDELTEKIKSVTNK